MIRHNHKQVMRHIYTLFQHSFWATSVQELRQKYAAWNACLKTRPVMPGVLVMQNSGEAADGITIIGSLLHCRASLQQVRQYLRHLLEHCGHVQQLQQNWQHCPVGALQSRKQLVSGRHATDRHYHWKGDRLCSHEPFVSMLALSYLATAFTAFVCICN